MARKAIRGYTEKSYYENTSFKGIVATTDPLNEGNFAHMVNFDISDTGNSLKPRCGFITTDLLLYTEDGYDTTKLNANSTIYFYEPTIQKYIFVDFSTFKFNLSTLTDYTYTMNAYTVVFDAVIAEGHTNKHFIAERISNIDLSDIFNLFKLDTHEEYLSMESTLQSITFDKTLAEYIVDEYSIHKYLIKKNLSTHTNISWLEFYYREKSSTYDGITFEDNTLVMSYTNTEDVVSIDTSQRNIASTANIIPNPMQKIYDKDSYDLAYNQFPLIYVKENSTQKYLINTSNDSDVTFIPHFLLKEIDANTFWMYTYKIMSTNYNANYYDDSVFNSNIYTISDGKALASLWYERMYEAAKKLQPESSLYNNTIYNYTLYASALDIHNVNSIYFYWLYVLGKSKSITNHDLYAGNLYTSTKDYDEDDLLVNSNLKEYIQTINDTDKQYFKSTEFTDSVLIYIVPNSKYYGDDIQLSISSDYNDTLNHTLIDFLYKVEEINNDLGGDYYRRISSNEPFIRELSSINTSTIEDLVTFLKGGDYSKYAFYIVPFSEITNSFSLNPTLPVDNTKGISRYKNFSLYSGLAIFDTEPVPLSELILYIKNHRNTNILFKCMREFYEVHIDSDSSFNFSEDPRAYQIVPNAHKLESNHSGVTYYVCASDWALEYEVEFGDITTNISSGSYAQRGNHLVSYFYKVNITSDNTSKYISIPLLDTMVRNPNRSGVSDVIERYICRFDSTLWSPHCVHIIDDTTNNVQQTHFTHTEDLMYLDISTLSDLHNRNYFTQGASISMNIIPVHMPSTFMDFINLDPLAYNIDQLNISTTLISSRTVTHGHPVTYIQEQLVTEPKEIMQSDKWLVFHSEQGDRLVTYTYNKVYVSEANKYYYFKDTNVFSYPERILKVIQFKNTLLVFTTINLYSIYPYEDTVTVESGKDAEGNIQYVQNKVIYYATLPVLYNLMLTEQYIDAIQVFNQMVLFYSADGQLFMIKPTATIDNDTKFTIQYFNKSANDILLNYVQYMNERLTLYNVPYTIPDKAQVKIKVQVNINYIKIFYMYRDYTYILIYDVINNYFYAYDTLSFSDIKNILFTEEGDVYVTVSEILKNKDNIQSDKYLYFTIKNNIPNEMDNNIDEAIYYNFIDTPIYTELDTGVLNLNTHLKKRFRDLHTVYKNITATYLNFELETFIDDVPAQVVLDNSITVTSTVGEHTQYLYDCVEIKNTTDLLKYNALFDFSLFTSNKMLTHYSSIPCLGKQFRLRLRFNSKGIYKLQSYGITFKEHQI